MNMINDRYLIKNRLFFGTSLGELYQVRDTKADRNTAPTELLLHALPSTIFGYPEFKQACADLKETRNSELSIPILPVLDYGWTGKEAFFIIQPPEDWAYTSLPPIKNARVTTPHQRAISIVKELLKARLINNKLCASFFIVTPKGDLHLLGTALSTTIQQQQNSTTIPLTDEKTRKVLEPFWRWAFLTMGIIGAAGATGIYTVTENNQEKTTDLTEISIPETVIVGTPAHDTPVTVQTSELRAPEPAVILEQKDIKWNGMDEAQLIQRVDSAYQQRRLQTAMYFARILWRQGSRDKELIRLLEAIAQHHQEQALAMHNNGNTAQAKLSQRLANHLINEFALNI